MSYRLSIAAISLALTSFLSAEGETLAVYRGGEVTESEFRDWKSALDETLPKFSEAGLVRLFAMDEYLVSRFDPSIPDDEFRVRLRLLEARMLQAEFFKNLRESIEIDRSELDAEIERTKEAMSRPARIRLRNIFRSGDDASETLQQLRERVRGGADFATLAMERSQSSNRFDGGLLGNIRRGQLPAEIEETVFALEPGQASEPLETGSGYTIFYCEDRLPAIEPSAEQVRERAKNALVGEALDKEKDRLETTWMAEVEMLETDDPAVRISDTTTLSVGEVEVLGSIRPFVVATRAAEQFEESGEIPNDVLREIKWRKFQLTAERERFRRFQKTAGIPAPSEKETRALFDELSPELNRPPSYRLSIASLPVTRDTFRDHFAAFQEGRKNAIENPGRTLDKAFANVAVDPVVRVSEWLDETQLRSLGAIPFRVVKGMGTPGLSPVFQSNGGRPLLMMIRVHETELSRPLTYDEALPGLVDVLTERKTKEGRKRFDEELLREMNFESQGSRN